MSAISRAVLSADLDERQMVCLITAGGWAGAAALGVLVRRVIDVIRNDRKLLRSWTATTKEPVA
jgi:hypothetical protein